MQHGVSVTLDELIALRRQAAAISLPGQQSIRSHLLGGHLSRLRGRGMEFSEVRGYQAGDDIRHMEWRVTARTGTPHTKLYQEERERPVYCFVDFSPSMFFATKVAFKAVLAARIAAILAWAAALHGDRVGGLVLNEQDIVEIRPRSRKQGVLALLNAIAGACHTQYQEDSGELFSEGILKLRRVVKPGSLIIMISDFFKLKPAIARQLAHLSRHNQILACVTRDVIECQALDKGRYPISDGQLITSLDLSDDQSLQQYHQFFQQQRDNLQILFNQMQISALDVMTSDAQVEQLTRFLATQLNQLGECNVSKRHAQAVA